MNWLRQILICWLGIDRIDDELDRIDGEVQDKLDETEFDRKIEDFVEKDDLEDWKEEIEIQINDLTDDLAEESSQKEIKHDSQ